MINDMQRRRVNRRGPFALTALVGIVAAASSVAPLAAAPARRPAKAPVAVISGSGRYLVGGYVDGRWVKADVVEPNLPGAAEVRSVGLSGASTVGTRPLNPVRPDDICSWNWSFSDLVPENTNGVYVVGATWPLMPRPVERLDPNGETYRTIVGNFLKSKGLPTPVVRITGLYRADLDGDKKLEVVITASNFRATGDFRGETRVGDYDLVLVRSVKGAAAVDQIVHFETFRAGNGVASEGGQHALEAIADLDGDGRMELVVDASYWESFTTEVYRSSTTGAWRSVVEEGCGV